ncbi:hypothetical protein [Pedobacter sp. Leaf41]|jgi:hypothetical protein|uniref:hypothetical protein n=1 Tax=Pedobacter sp. Leaf41 TaxID=1736218 RepID=UPI000A629D70|nr:hypothetical protein [Pedobacter sp. Leaf41]RZL34383.1 MAG: hypothetical protein EOO96_09970 [Pedobacter sp.]
MKAAVIIILLIASLNTVAQKAFEMEHYYGKTKNFEIKLSLANGYILGSKIIKTDIKTDKVVKYLPNKIQGENTLSLVFLPDINDKTIKRRKRDNIILYKMKDDYEMLPDKIIGSYGVDLKTYSFKLYKLRTNH